MITYKETQHVMQVMELGPKVVRAVLPYSSLDSYTAPTKRQAEHHFLTQEHVDTLKEESCITQWDELGEEECIPGIGALRRIGFVTEQGYAYAALLGIPESPKSHIPIVGTSAWFTSIEGHNEHTVRNLVRAGNYVFFVGAEGSYEPELETPTPQSAISLAGSAAAVLNFSYHAVNELVRECYHIDTEERIIVGESRGAMVGMGIAALSEEFGQTIVFSDLIAPCLPRRLSFPDIRHLIGQVAQEPKELLRLMGKMTLGRGIHYPATFDPSPYSLKHQLAIGFALFSGEAGMLARHIARDSLMHITTFDNDFASMTKEWEQIFKDHPNVRITPLPGSHLTIADHETLQYILARNYAAQLSLNAATLLTQETVFDAAHKFINSPQTLATAA